MSNLIPPNLPQRMGRKGAIYCALTGMMGIMSVLILTACDTIIPINPTEIPTWEYTAPTLAPTEVFYALPPTPPPLNEPVAGQNSNFAAALPANAELPPLVLDELETGVQNVQMTLREGQILIGTFYPPAPIEVEGRFIRPRLPAILLLGTALEWADFPERLRDAGYVVLVMDMRSIGLASAVEDILAGLSVSDSVYPALIAVMAAGDNADFALIACANNAVCDAVVLFSPRNQATLVNVVGGFVPRPSLVVVNQTDLGSYQTALALDAIADESMTLITLAANRNGAELLVEQPTLGDEVISWLMGALVE